MKRRAEAVVPDRRRRDQRTAFAAPFRGDGRLTPALPLIGQAAIDRVGRIEALAIPLRGKGQALGHPKRREIP